jgi:glycosyltransferase involved in cell wall biosynthesis
MRRMRIALLAPFGLRAKGTTRARTLPMALALARRGHTVAVFIPPYDSPEDAGRRWREDEVDIVNVPLPHGAQTAPWHWQLGWRLYQSTLMWRPQIVHAFKPKGPSGLAATLLWTRRRLVHPRLVVDSDDWEGPGGWNDHPAAAYSEGQKRFFAWQEKYGLSHADAWTVTSVCLEQRALRFGAAAGRVHVLHNGLDRGDFAEYSSSGPLPGARYAVLYTRFAGVRPDDVKTIWARVRAQVPDVRLLVIGRGQAGEEDGLRGEMGIEVMGWQEPASVRGLLASAALAIAPWTDTPTNQARHSAKILSIMGAGVPIVATAVGELPVTLGAGGVLVSPGAPDEFAAAVVTLLRDEGRAHALGLAARQRALTAFNWDALVEVALGAYGIA